MATFVVARFAGILDPRTVGPRRLDLVGTGANSSSAIDCATAASGPVSENKQSAAAVLVREPGMPPPSLLPEVMQLIRSPEYFCYPNLTQFVPRFGSDAVGYLEELKELRVILSNRIGTAAGLRLAGSQQLDAVDLEMMDKAIMAIENMSTAN